jgi:hypothetical protein
MIIQIGGEGKWILLVPDVDMYSWTYHSECVAEMVREEQRDRQENVLDSGSAGLYNIGR